MPVRFGPLLQAAGGPVEISPELIDHAGQLLGIEVSQQTSTAVDAPLIEQLGEAAEPSVVSLVTLVRLDAAGQVAAVEVRPGVSPALIDRSGVLFAIQVDAQQVTVDLPRLEDAGLALPIAVAAVCSLARISSPGASFAPSVDRQEPPPPPPVTYALELRDLDGTTVASDVPFHRATVTWDIDGPGAIEVTLAPANLGSSLWLPGQRRVVVLADGTPVWQGWLLDMERDGKPGEVTWTARGLGLASVLDKRVVHGDFTKTEVVATTIAWQLIQHAQSQTDGDHGFTLGTISGTAPARTRTYCDGDNIREAIDDLASRDPGGFDWEIDAQGRFNAWVPRRAQGKLAITITDADVMEMRASKDVSELASYVTALGDDPDGPCGPPLVTRSDSTLAASYKRREVPIDVGTNDSGELTEAADHELAIRRRGGLQLEVVVEPRADPKGLAALDIGDRVTAVLAAELGGPQVVRLVRKSITLEPPDFAFAALQFEGDA
jgi:hypothetical protein